MSKRVQIAVIREATLNAKPTDTHYLAEGGLRISRSDARALKGKTLYYEVLVDLGEVKGFDFIPGRDIPVYQTDSEPVLALDPQSLRLVAETQVLVKAFLDTCLEEKGPISSVSSVSKVDSSILMQNAVEMKPIIPVANAEVTTEAPVKRKPGRPKKVVAEAPAPAPVVEVAPEVPAAVVEPISDFEVEEPGKQDDESTFLIDPTGMPAVRASKPEFSFEVDEDEAPPPPPARSAAPLDFEVEDDEPAAAPAAAQEPEAPAASINTDDFGDVEPGLFDE